MINEPEKKSKFQAINVAVVSGAHMVHDIYSSFLAPLLPLLIEKLSISYSSVSLLSVMQRIPSLFNPLIGLAADKLPIRYLLIIAPAITATTMSLVGVAESYTVLLILLFVMGIGSAIFHTPSPVMIRKLSGSRVGKGMSFYMLGGELARSVGPLIILGAVYLWGLEGTYRLMPFGLTASAILYLKLRKIKISEDFQKKEKDKKVAATIKELRPFLISVSGILFFRAILKGALTTFLPTFLTSRGEALWLAGISLSVLQFSGAAGTLFAGSISDKLGRKKTLYIAAVAVPALMFLFLNSSGYLKFGLLILLGLFLFALEPVMLAVVNEKKTDRPSFVNGLYMSINFVLSAVAIFVVGVLGDLIGLEQTYIVAIVLSLITIPFIYFLNTEE